MSENYSKSRILKNSVFLYGRMLITVWLNLYTTRLTLANLGVEDLGVYGVVGSLVSVFAVFSGGITNAVQRFITYEIGRKGQVNTVFCSSLNIIFLLSAIIFLLLEGGGLWFLNHKLNIPAESLSAAFWVFQLSVLTCIVNLISVPYNALIIAHEKMNVFAYISILQVLLTCGAAYSLSFFPDHRLVIYAVAMAVVSILIRLLYQWYCHARFAEAVYHLTIDKAVWKEIGKFAGISSVSGILQVAASQGLVFVVNMVFGVALNAVYNIANQLKNSIMSFSLNLFKAIAPQITKTYANGEMETHKKMIYAGCKLEIYLFLVIMIPFLFRTHYIMSLWLGEVPPYAVEFVKATVFVGLMFSAFEPIRTAVMATGHITKFMLYPYLFYLIVLPVSYILGVATDSPVWMIGGIVIVEILLCLVQIYYASRVTVITMQEWAKRIFLPGLIVALGASAICYLLTRVTDETIGGLILLVGLNTLGLIGGVYMIGLSCEEKKLVNRMLSRFFRKLMS